MINNIINKNNTWRLINLFIILLSLFYISVFICETGMKTIVILVKSGHLRDFIAALFLLILLIFFNIFTLLHCRDAKRKKLHYLVRTAAILQLAALVAAGTLVPHHHRERIYGKKPNFPEQYSNRIGPIIQPGPVINRKIKASDSMVIWWFDPVKKDKSVYLKYGVSPDPGRMKTIREVSGGDGKKHLVILKKLRPRSKYYYYIPGFDETIYSFHTGPGKGETLPFSFLCTGDVTNKGGRTVSFSEIINKSADSHYRKAGKRPAFKLILGDIASRGRDMESWKIFFSNEALHSSIYPLLTVIGNHEFMDDYGGNFDYLMEHPRYYSFDYSGAHFLIIHKYDGFLGSVGREQYRFIERDLRETCNKKWIIVALHEPLLSTGDYKYNSLLISQLFDLFRKYRVDLVLAGHDHSYDSFWVDRDSRWGGTIHIVNGGGGSRIDDYIMRRKEIRWKTWYHDRNSSYGLYSDDEFTVKYHIYGEISWGFMDIEIRDNSLKTTYYRWMTIEKYRKATGQEKGRWEMLPLERTGAKPVHSLFKKRYFEK
jgi:predicted phosphodiesterase